MAEIKKVYQSFDHDPLTVQDMEAAMKMLGRDPVECELTEMMHDINSSGNTVDFDEFVTILSTTSCETMAGAILEALLELDTEGTGYVGPKALRKMITQMGVEIDEETFEEILKESQKNVHGKISIQSFVSCMVGENSGEALKRMKSCVSATPSSRTSRMYSEANNEGSANIPETIVEEGSLIQSPEDGETQQPQQEGEGEEVTESGNNEEESQPKENEEGNGEDSNEVPPAPEENADPKPITESEEKPEEQKKKTELKSPTSPQPEENNASNN